MLSTLIAIRIKFGEILCVAFPVIEIMLSPVLLSAEALEDLIISCLKVDLNFSFDIPIRRFVIEIRTKVIKLNFNGLFFISILLLLLILKDIRYLFYNEYIKKEYFLI
jgi:hypothetical protein